MINPFEVFPLILAFNRYKYKKIVIKIKIFIYRNLLSKCDILFDVWKTSLQREFVMNKKSEYFTIPNLMGYFRILLVPVYLVFFYYSASTKEWPNVYYWLTLATIVVSGLTDFFDGRVARRFNQVTDFGKMLDPIADKITIGAIIVSLAWQHKIVIVMIILYIIKEGYMALMGMRIMKKGGKVDGAMWYGKVCTFVTYVVLIIILVFPRMDEKYIIGLAILNMAVMLFTFIMYIPYHIKKFKELK